MKLRLVALVLVLAGLFPGCASYPKPDPSIVAWNQGSAEACWERAFEHATRIEGVAFEGVAFRIAPTGSMEPFLVGGDCIVVDFSFPFAQIKRGDLITYDANWTDPNTPFVTHMAVEKTGDAWIMTGLSNQYSESGSRAMTSADYRGKVVQVYTIRKKP